MKSSNEKVNLKTQQNAKQFIGHDVSVEKHDSDHLNLIVNMFKLMIIIGGEIVFDLVIKGLIIEIYKLLTKL